MSTNQYQKSKITGKADLQMGLNCHATGGDNGMDSIEVRHKTTWISRLQLNVSLKFSHISFLNFSFFFLLSKTVLTATSSWDFRTSPLTTFSTAHWLLLAYRSFWKFATSITNSRVSCQRSDSQKAFRYSYEWAQARARPLTIHRPLEFLLVREWFVFTLEDALSVWTNLGKHSLFVSLFVSSAKTGKRCVIRHHELSSVVRRSSAFPFVRLWSQKGPQSVHVVTSFQQVVLHGGEKHSIDGSVFQNFHQYNRIK